MGAVTKEELASILKKSLTQRCISAETVNNSSQFCFPDQVINPIDIYAFTDRGLKRDHNEDSFLATSIHIWCRGNIVNLTLLIVADGVGGGKGGELASEATVTGMFLNVLNDVLNHVNTEKHELLDFSPILIRGVEATNEEILRIAKVKSYDDMASTMVIGVICDNRLIIGNLGDSRLYRIKDGRLIQETEDHSLVGEIVKAGMLTKEQSKSHKLRSTITRAMGSKDNHKPDIYIRTINPGEMIFMCSDGIHGVMSDRELNDVFQQTSDLRVSSGRIMQTVLNREAPDNFTLLLSSIPESKPLPTFVRLTDDMAGKMVIRFRNFGETKSEFELHIEEKSIT